MMSITKWIHQMKKTKTDTVGFSCAIDRKLNDKLLAKIAQVNASNAQAGEPPISKSIIVRQALVAWLRGR
jgi:hypothetical protein